MEPIFQKNIALLEKIDPKLAKRIVSVKLSDTVIVSRTPKGYASASVKGADQSFIYVCSTYDPVSEARDFSSQNFGNHEAYCVSGFGLGYHMIEFARKIKADAWLCAVEAREDVFRAALENVDLGTFFSRPNVRIFVGQDINEFLGWARDFFNDSEINEMICIVHPPSSRIMTKFYKQVEFEMQNAINKRMVELITLVRNARQLDQNLVRNIPSIARSFGVSNFFEKFKGIPAFVVAAGPSLDYAIDRLSQAKGKGVIICVGKSLRLLCEKGIVPEFAANLDMTEQVVSYFKDLDIPAETSLLFDPDSYFEITSKYPHKLVVYDTTAPIYLWTRNFITQKGFIPKGMSVAHAAFYFARALGCDPIILLGVDCSLPTGKTHAKGVTQTWGGDVQEFNTDPNLVFIPSVKGDLVRSLKSLQSFVTTLEADIAETKATVINTSEIGALIRGAVNIPFDQVLSKYCLEQKPIANILKECFTAEMSFNKEKFVELSNRALESSVELIKLCDEALRTLSKIARLDRSNRNDEQEFQRLALKTNEMRAKLFSMEYVFPLLQRLVSSEALDIKELRLKAKETTDPKETKKLETEMMLKLFSGYKEAAKFFAGELEHVLKNEYGV